MIMGQEGWGHHDAAGIGFPAFSNFFATDADAGHDDAEVSDAVGADARLVVGHLDAHTGQAAVGGWGGFVAIVAAAKGIGAIGHEFLSPGEGHDAWIHNLEGANGGWLVARTGNANGGSFTAATRDGVAEDVLD